ncbi:MAG: cysteinyl-tRNA synthetase [Actinomycetota bacterium]|nr:cysteinyl-tRNA synthetase [Actinomycetota bacterium]
MPVALDQQLRPVTIAGRPLPLMGKARVYVCGVTPSDVTHLGHASTYVWVDVVGRLLRHLGTDVEVCRNVTDVDDVLLAASRRAGAPYDAFAAVQQYQFEQDMAALGVRRPAHEPRAHNFVRQVVALAVALVDSGAAYVRDGTVYFRGADLPAAAGLTRDAARALLAEFLDEPDDPAKDDPFDVAVWRATQPGAPAWPSPWGQGRPGWHAECTAMALSAYGSSVDLHAGGADLEFPHHTYEAAMAEAFTGVRPFSRAWMHVGMVRVEGAKMAKSAHNLVLVSDLLSAHTPAALRLLLLRRPWIESWNFEAAELAVVENELESLFSVSARPAKGASAGTAAQDAVLSALRDDIDVRAALEIALDEGGPAARTVIEILGLR